MSVRWAMLGMLVALSAQSAQPPAASTPAQQPPQGQRPPVFRSGAEVVRVDVAVLDGNGRPIRNLRAEDFELAEDNAPQTIQSFSELDLAAEPADDRSLEISNGYQAEQELAREDVRVFLIYWDDYHIAPNFQPQLLRDALVDFLRTKVAPTDLIAIMDQWTIMSDLKWTRNTGELWSYALALKGRAGVYIPPRNVAEENHLREFGSIERLRAEVSLSALESAMAHLASKREGRKAIVYFSGDFGLGDRMDTFNRTVELIRSANDANVALYAISPEGIGMRGRRMGILTDLARESGGESMYTNDPRVALQRVVEQTGSVYLLGYSPAPLRQDGKFHKIKVNVKRSGAQVRARAGYWAPDEKTIAKVKAENAAAPVVARGVTAAIGQLARLDWHDGDKPLALPTAVEPDPPSAAVAIERARVWQVTRPAELSGVLGDNPPEPTAQRAFARTDRLIVRFTVIGTEAETATVTASLVDRRGQKLTDLTLRGEGTNWLLDLPLSSIAKGDYVLALDGRAGEARSTAYVPLRVK